MGTECLMAAQPDAAQNVTVIRYAEAASVQVQGNESAVEGQEKGLNDMSVEEYLGRGLERCK